MVGLLHPLTPQRPPTTPRSMITEWGTSLELLARLWGGSVSTDRLKGLWKSKLIPMGNQSALSKASEVDGYHYNGYIVTYPSIWVSTLDRL
jgi:hypothetical protein